jgi:hypothetical protein
VSIWAVTELVEAEFGDTRLGDRLIRMVDTFAERPEASVPEAFGKAGAKAAYRFWDNEQVTPERVLAPHVARTARRASEQAVVLAVQDTTEVNLSHHPATQGTGYLASPGCRGLLLHSVLAVSTDGIPLGLLHQQTWTRPPEQLGKSKGRRQKSVEEKESQRWLTGLAAAERALPNQPRVVVVGDRESDLFDLFVAPRRDGVELLVRVCRTTRRVEHSEKYLREALLASPVQGTIRVEVPRGDDRRPRTATLSVRFISVKVPPPRNHKDRRRLKPVTLQFVLVQEEDPPAGEKPICWLLATTLRVESFEDAVRCVRWYVLRWRIERFHFTLKSGCRIEQRELETVERMERAVATFSIVAWRLLWLTYAAREHPDASCEGILEAHEWQSLYATIHRTPRVPDKAPTLRQAVRMIACLGGFLGRQRDGEPGVKTLWRGMRRLHDISETWRLLASLNRPPPLLFVGNE